ncbi:MAG: hypothetical protein WC422_03300 [Candidatus Paceibacterota bacterium]|jgi:hypothetical protein
MKCKNPLCGSDQRLPPHRVNKYGFVWFCIECRLLHHAYGEAENKLVVDNGCFVFVNEDETLKLVEAK